MSTRRLPRQLGIVLRCNGEGCGIRFQTANVLIRVNRRAAAKDGWIRGGGRGRMRLDFCPTCAPVELEQQAKRRREIAERRKERDRKRRELATGTENQQPDGVQL